MAQLKVNLRQEIARQDKLSFAQSLGFTPDPWQEKFLNSTAKRRLLNCSRQVGKSTICAIDTLHLALYEPKSLILVLAPAERQAKEYFSKVMDFYRRLGYHIPSRSERKLGLQLDNQSRIEALPGSEKTIRGFSGVAKIVLDEAARVPDGLYHAVRPMLATTGGSMDMLSSPYGKRGVFYEEWHGTGTWERYEVNAYESVQISREFIEEERNSLPRMVFEQEYMCRFVELDDAVFTEAEIAAAMDAAVTPLFGIGA